MCSIASDTAASTTVVACVSRAKRDLLGWSVLLWLEPCPGKESGKKRVYNNYWPQERPNPFAADCKRQKIKRDERAIGQHAASRGAAGPTTHAQCEQGDAKHTRHRYNNASKFFAEQQPPDQGRNNKQPHPRSHFKNGGDSQYFLHRATLLKVGFIEMWARW